MFDFFFGVCIALEWGRVVALIGYRAVKQKRIALSVRGNTESTFPPTGMSEKEPSPQNTTSNEVSEEKPWGRGDHICSI